MAEGGELKRRSSGEKPSVSSSNKKKDVPTKESMDRDRSLLFRGLIVWMLGVIFLCMMFMLIAFLYLENRSPLTEEDIEQCRKDEYNPNSDVIQLTQVNFFNETSQKDTSWLVEMYSPTCSHCRRMKKAWEETATQLKAEGFFKVGKVDCKCEVPVCRPFKVQHYPGIYLIENGDIIRYDSKMRTTDSFISWAKQVSDRYQKLQFEI